MLQRASRQSFLDAHRFSRGEIALQLAQSGLNIGWQHLSNLPRQLDSDLYRELFRAAPNN